MTILAKNRFFCDFGIPGGCLGKALGKNFGKKMLRRKNDEKKVVRMVASAGSADPGKEGF